MDKIFEILVKMIFHYVRDIKREEEAKAIEEEAIRQADNWSDADKEAFKIIMAKQKLD